MDVPPSRQPLSLNLFQVNLFVCDFQQSLRFYRDRLGLEVLEIDPGPLHLPLVNWVSLSAGSVILEIFDAQSAGRSVAAASGRGTVELAFLVGDVEQQRRRLGREGIECTPTVTRSWGRVSHFDDPDGNPLQIYEIFGSADTSLP